MYVLTIIALRPIVLDILYICKELCLDELYLYVLPICLLNRRFFPKKNNKKCLIFHKFCEITINIKVFTYTTITLVSDITACFVPFTNMLFLKIYVALAKIRRKKIINILSNFVQFGLLKSQCTLLNNFCIQNHQTFGGENEVLNYTI